MGLLEPETFDVTLSADSQMQKLLTKIARSFSFFIFPTFERVCRDFIVVNICTLRTSVMGQQDCYCFEEVSKFTLHLKGLPVDTQNSRTIEKVE